ncbi:MAG TPA: putative metal-dependent hydrolase [Vicinamibacterales bacterium]|nr:putative metal-dependent hydrolase [Vicinamibacterales bacterium]
MTDLDKLRYPVGPLPRAATPLDKKTRQAHLETLEQTPARIRALVSGLTDRQLDTPYRPGGWTVRQVVHHLPDSHMNAYIRHKLAVTEEMPAVKTYHEDRWAELPEAKSAPVDFSVALLDALHRRWVAFLRALPEAELQKAFSHPEWKRVTVDESIAMYAWHCRHHTAHIEQALRLA